MRNEVTEAELESAKRIFADHPAISNNKATDILVEQFPDRSWYGAYYVIRKASDQLRGEARARVKGSAA